MICPYCGGLTPDNSKFCTECGVKYNEQNAEPGTATVDYAPRFYEAQAPEQTYYFANTANSYQVGVPYGTDGTLPQNGYAPNTQGNFATPAGYEPLPAFQPKPRFEEGMTPAESGPWKVFAVLGMVLGIISLAVSWIPVLGIGFIGVAEIGFVFSILGMKSKKNKKKAVVGLILSILAFIACITFFLLFENGTWLPDVDFYF